MLDNFTKHVYHDLSTFLEDDHGFDFELYKAAVESDDSPITQKYIEFLNMSSEKERIMNMAFEYQDIITRWWNREMNLKQNITIGFMIISKIVI